MIKVFTYIIFILLFAATEGYSQNQPDLSNTIELSLHPSNPDTLSFNIFPKKFNKKKVALVLSGGGARGIAQIGVLKALEEHNIVPDLIVGTSIGSVMGGLYSSGYTADELAVITKGIDWENRLSLSNKFQRENLYLDQKKILDKSLLSFSLDGLQPLLPTSLSSGQQITEMINVLVLNSRYKHKRDFSDLKIPFAAVATNIDNGERTVLMSGNLSESIKASMTFPLLYSPTKLNDKNLVDGGLTANIPVDVADELGADLTIAVNSTSPLREAKELYNPLNTADQILSISMEKLNQIQLSKADIIITPDVGDHSSTDFRDIDSMISSGKLAAELKIQEIKNRIESLEFSSSVYFNNFVTSPSITVSSVLIPDSLKIKILSRKDFIRFVEIEENLKHIYRTGYFSNVRALVSRDSSGAFLRYQLTENPVLKAVSVNADYPFLNSIIEDFKNDNGFGVINHNSAYKLYEDLLGALRNNNLSFVDIDRFYLEPSSGTLYIHFTPGIINRIDYTGNDVTNDDILRREMTLKPGQRALKPMLEASLKNVYSTNLFQQVSLDVDYAPDGSPNLYVNVVERSSRNLRFSMRVDNERNLQLLLDLRDENLFGTGQELGITGSGGLRNREYRAELKSNRFFNTLLTYTLTGAYSFRNINGYAETINNDINELQVQQINEYRNIRFGGSFLLGTQLEIGSQLQRFGILYSQLSYENIQYNKLEGTGPPNEEFNVSKLKLGGTIDTQDKIPFPDAGSFLNFFYETSLNELGSDLSYSKLFIDYEQYLHIGTLHTLKPRFVFGFADKTTPIAEFFSIGGQNSFFGMVEDQQRGRQILNTSLEYRFLLPYRLFFDTYLRLRYDLGKVWENTEDIRFKDLRHGIGFTASFDTPIGESSFSVGRSFIVNRGLTRDSFIFGPYTFYYSIGYNL